MAFGDFGQQGIQQPMSEINTTPLVDVMLVLLIIFIVTAPLITHSIPVDLPKAGSTATPEKPEIITISLNQEGGLFWNDSPVAASDLANHLAEASLKNPQPELHLRASRDTRYQQIMEIMSVAQNAGIQKLGFVSQLQPPSR